MVRVDSRPSNASVSDFGDTRLRGAQASAAVCECSRRINELVVEDVVPHLVRSLSRNGRERDEHASCFDDGVVREFTAAVLAVEDRPSSRFIEALRADGTSVETIYLGLFPAAARLLGEYWKSDRCHFSEVTLGLWRLHRLVRDMSHDFRTEATRGRRFLHALITTAPGEQHCFGVTLVSEWFRRAGWSLVPSPLRTNAEISRAVALDYLTVVGFSISSEAHLEGLCASIAVVRRKSRNRSVGVMVGGSLFRERPSLAVDVGADATAHDAADAIAKAERFAICGDWASL